MVYMEALDIEEGRKPDIKLYSTLPMKRTDLNLFLVSMKMMTISGLFFVALIARSLRSGLRHWNHSLAVFMLFFG